MYPPEVRITICERMAEGESLSAICRDPKMPGFRTVMTWLDEDETFQHNYARANSVRADLKFEELDDVADEAVASESAIKVAALRLKADIMKWQLAKMNAKKYGDKVDLNHGGSVKFERIETFVVDPAR